MNKTLQALITLLVVALMFALVPFGFVPMVYSINPPRKQSQRLRAARRRGDVQQSLATRRAYAAPGSGTPMTRSEFENITGLALMLRTVFFDQLTAIADAGGNDLLQLFDVQTSRRAAERDQGIGGLGDVPEYQGALEYDSFEQMYRTVYTHKEYAKGIAIERALIDDDEYGVMRDRARLMGISFDRTAYKAAASVFNNAFSASYVGGDAVALCSASHPLAPSSSSVQSNTGTSALSDSAVTDTIEAMMAFTDSRGNPMTINPDTLVVPVGLRKEALTIAGSQQQPGNANNDVNTNAGLKVKVSRLLTDANNWFVVDSMMAKTFLKWFWRIRPEFTEDPTSNYALALKFRGYMRYSYGWSHWAWIYGHSVT